MINAKTNTTVYQADITDVEKKNHIMSCFAQINRMTTDANVVSIIARVDAFIIVMKGG